MSRKKIQSLTSEEILKITAHDFANVEDIQKLGCCGKNRAYEYIAEIRRMMKESGKRIISPRGKIKMDYVIQYFDIDEQRHLRRLMVGGVVNGRER